MKKSDKKIENTLRIALTKVCEIALDEVSGFRWLTHLVDYNNFPGSLSVVCVFHTNEDLCKAKSVGNDEFLIRLIKTELEKGGIKIRDINSLVKFDTEENCKAEHNGRWNERLE